MTTNVKNISTFVIFQMRAYSILGEVRVTFFLPSQRKANISRVTVITKLRHVTENCGILDNCDILENMGRK